METKTKSAPLRLPDEKWECLPAYLGKNVWPIGYATDGSKTAYNIPVEVTGSVERADQVTEALNGYPVTIDALREVVRLLELLNAPDTHDPIEAAIYKARAVLAAYDKGEQPATPSPLTLADLQRVADANGVFVSPSDRAGCFDLYWRDRGHAFAVSVRDAIETIKWNTKIDARRLSTA